MAAIRESILINGDVGLPIVVGIRAGVVDNQLSATRYANVADFTNVMTTTFWDPTIWGDGDKTLADIINGYRIVESIFTEPPIPSVFNWDLSPSAPSVVFPSALDIKRTSVMYSVDNDGYLYVNPGTTGAPPNQQEFAFVSSAREATRFDNLLNFKTLLDNSVLGDLGSWRIEQQVFTNQGAVQRVDYFSGSRMTQTNIELACVAFSKEQGKYLRVNDLSLPFNQMQFAYTSNVYEATRCLDSAPFQAILDNTVLGQAAYGFDLTRYYFDRPIQPIGTNPFEQFWCIDNNGPFKCIGFLISTCQWLCSLAGILPWRAFYAEVVGTLLDPKCYFNSNEFETWWAQQDFSAFEQWLYEKWKECLSQSGGAVLFP